LKKQPGLVFLSQQDLLVARSFLGWVAKLAIGHKQKIDGG
jgi:hypothetical protein